VKQFIVIRCDAWQITTHLCIWPNSYSRCWPNTKINSCVCHKTPLTLLNARFPVSCHKNTVGGKSFEGVGRIESKATQQLLQMHHANYRRCFEQKSPWNKLIQAEVFWFRRDHYVLKVTTVLLVRQRQSGYFLIRPDGGTSEYLTLHTEGLCSPH